MVNGRKSYLGGSVCDRIRPADSISAACARYQHAVFHLQLFAPRLLTQGVRAFVRPSRALLILAT